MQPNLTGVTCLFLPLSASAAISMGYDVNNTFRVFFEDGTDVVVNDRLTWNNNTYTVKGIEDYTGTDPVSHVEVFAVTENAHV
jgi:hypothetical protein